MWQQPGKSRPVASGIDWEPRVGTTRETTPATSAARERGHPQTACRVPVPPDTPIANRTLPCSTRHTRSRPSEAASCSRRRRGGHPSHQNMANLERELQLGRRGCVPHGFPSASKTGLPNARRRHARSANSPWRTSTTTASRRSDLFERHRVLMQQWVDYIAAERRRMTALALIHRGQQGCRAREATNRSTQHSQRDRGFEHLDPTPRQTVGVRLKRLQLATRSLLQRTRWHPGKSLATVVRSRAHSSPTPGSAWTIRTPRMPPPRASRSLHHHRCR